MADLRRGIVVIEDALTNDEVRQYIEAIDRVATTLPEYRDNAYSYDMGYPVPTELPDGRIFVAYWFCAKEQDEPIEDVQIVRHIAGSFFRLD